MINLTAMSADDLKRRVNAAVHRSDHVALEAALLELLRRNPMDIETVVRLTAAYKAQGARALAVVRVPWMEVRYEDLAGEFDVPARGVAEFLGLPWTDEASRFHERASERPIRTPSYLAVTEAAHTRAVGRWRHYRRHLEPIMDRLQPMVAGYGYGAD